MKNECLGISLNNKFCKRKCKKLYCHDHKNQNFLYHTKLKDLPGDVQKLIVMYRGREITKKDNIFKYFVPEYIVFMVMTIFIVASIYSNTVT